MKNLLLIFSLFCLGFTSQQAVAQCNAAFTWEQVPNTLNIQFHSQSTSEHDIISHFWTFGDNHNGDGQHPLHAYGAPGVYLVCLTIEDNEGCEDDVCHEVTVQPINNNICEAAFNFEINQQTNTVSFNDNSFSNHEIISWFWDFGDGFESDDENPTHIYDNPGVYEVCLTITDNTGCTDEVCHAVTILEDDDCEAFFEYEITGLTVNFSDESVSDHEISQWTWYFGDDTQSDDQDPTHTYDEPGTYHVCLVIHSETGCVDEYCTDIVISGSGDDCHAEFTFEHNQQGNVWHFFDQSTSDHDIVSWQWNFGDGHSSDDQNPVHEYDEPGVYLVCLIITSETGCVSDHCEEIEVGEGGDGCHAEFTFETNQNGNVFHFFDQSTSEHDIVSWHWNFGDGHTSDDQNPVHEYSEPGVYVVCLIITSESGCVSDHCEEIEVGGGGDGCHAEFTFEHNQQGNFYHFFDQSTSEHQIISWQWNFGDGHTSNDQNPTHEYAEPGVYVVCLIITSETGCVSDHCEEIEVGEGGDGCHAEFGFQHNQQGNVWHFFDQSTSEHQIVSWQWNFGDGHSSNEQNPVHEYAEPGVYVVCLIITSETGCVSDHCETIEVGQGGDGCHAEFAYEHNQQGNVWHFFDQSTSEHQIVSWLWNFGDGHSSTQQNPVHEYAEPGVYVVCLIITSETGCVADHCEEITVGEEEAECNAFFTFQLDDELTVHFYNQSTSNHDIILYAWNFGDGHNGDGQYPTHHYDEPGSYEVCLHIVDNAGCEDTYCTLVVVEEQPCNVEFEWEYNEETDTLQFINNSSGATPSTIWLWDFGDGNFSVEENPQHQYEENGVYNICLFMIDTTTGCSDHECHVFVQNQEPEQGNYEQQEEEEQQNLVTDPTIRFTNPADDNMHIQIRLHQDGDATLYMYDMTGRRILTDNFGKLSKGIHSRFILLPDLPQGLYTISVLVGNKLISDHILIAK